MSTMTDWKQALSQASPLNSFMFFLLLQIHHTMNHPPRKTLPHYCHFVYNGNLCTIARFQQPQSFPLFELYFPWGTYT
ncbi:MAG: hypothetical protein IKP58_08550 [Victivallales bacterium]|nr:hypothetical protein [Victivallales bacterium]